MASSRTEVGDWLKCHWLIYASALTNVNCKGTAPIGIKGKEKYEQQPRLYTKLHRGLFSLGDSSTALYISPLMQSMCFFSIFLHYSPLRRSIQDLDVAWHHRTVRCHPLFLLYLTQCVLSVLL